MPGAHPEIRVATFNIRHGERPDGRVDNNALVEACAQLDADVLGLQEVDRGHPRSRWRDQSRIVARRLGYSRVFGPVLHRGLIRGYGNALLARGTIAQHAFVALPRPSERQARGAIIARVASDRYAFSVAVTHLQHHPAHLRHLPAEAPGQLAALLETFATWPAPRVLVGDFNLDRSHAIGLLTDNGFEVPVTAPTFPVAEPRLHLDYVAVDGIEVAGSEVVHTAVSDHCAVVVRLRPG
jgi:endonuclease/exonuclease/phosphatase family metal-dependent hydrolase